jgi:hypothetical protein
MSKVSNLPSSLYKLSGKIEVGVNGKHLAVAKLNLNNIVIMIDDEFLFKQIIKKLPVKIKAISIFSKISFLLYKSGLSVEVSDSKGTLMSLGSETYSPLRKVNVKLMKIRKYLK